MDIALKTDMQMLSLSPPKMFSLFLRVMAHCLLSLGDLTSEGESSGGGVNKVWEREGSRGRGTCQMSKAIPSQSLKLPEVGACLPGN